MYILSERRPANRRSGGLYTGLEYAPRRRRALSGVLGAVPPGLPNVDRDGNAACRGGAVPEEVLGFRRFSRERGSRDFVAILNVRCTNGYGREVATSLAWLEANLGVVPGVNRRVLAAAIRAVRERGQALTLEQVEEELAQADRQEEQRQRDQDLAELQEPRVDRTPPAARRGHDAELARRARQSGLEEEARRRGVRDLARAMHVNARLAAELGWAPILSVYAGGPGDPQLAVDVAIYQRWAELDAVDGMLGPNTMRSMRRVRERMLAGEVVVAVPRVALNIRIPGLADPLTAPAVPVAEARQPEGPAAEPGPTRAPRRRRPPTPVGEPLLNPTALAAAQRANAESAQRLGWRTKPVVYAQPGAERLALDIAFTQRNQGRAVTGVVDRVQLDLIARAKPAANAAVDGLPRLAAGIERVGGATGLLTALVGAAIYLGTRS